MMETIVFLQSVSYFGNTLWQLIISAFVFVILIGVLMLFQSIVLRRLKKLAEKTTTEADDVAIGIVASIRPPLYFIISLYISYRFLNFSSAVDSVVNFTFFVVVSFEVIRSFGKLVDYFIEIHTKKLTSEEEKKHIRGMMKIMKNLILVGLGILAVLLILSNYGVNVTSIVASLGIGGLAIALAVQNILSDIFSSFSIFIDKPFQIGDFIVVGTDMGTVQKIGLKTTRIKTLRGEELIISNKELTSARVQNYKRMERRRVEFNLGVVYGTDTKKLAKIPGLIESIITKVDGLTFSRCHFKSYEDSSLNYETVYFVETASYEQYMDKNQAINLAIYQAFEKEKIEFAYPTQTIFVKK